MRRSKEIQEQMRNKIVDMYQSGKVYKAISTALGLQRTTVRAIIHKWRKLGPVVKLPRSGRPTKITPRAQRRLIQEVIKEPRTTSKELQASLASIKVSVHDSTIRKRLGKNGIHGRVPRQKPLLTKKNSKARLCSVSLLCSFRTWTTCHNWCNHEFCTLSENPEGECPAVSLWPQAQAHLGYAAWQWSQTHQQVHIWMAQEKQN